MVGKYQAEIDVTETNTSQALAVSFIGRDKRVLDVGTATGYVAKVLSERGCAVTGIELNAGAAKQAEEFCDRVIVGDVESLDLGAELGEDSFDAILFGDVLEHLKDPREVLRRFEPFLRPEGYVVASIPNIAHGSVRLALMQGRFEYRQLGLLDDTHLRFFTRDSVEQLFNEAGFMVGELERVRLGIFETEIEVDREAVTEEMLEAVGKDPESETYQFVLTAHPSTYAGTFSKLSNEVRLLTERVEARDRLVHGLNRRLRRLEDLERQLERRDRQIANQEERIGHFKAELAERKRKVRVNEREIHRLKDQLDRTRRSGGDG